MKQLLFLFSLMLAVSTCAAEDVYIKSTNHTDAVSIMGQNQPASDTITEEWIGDGQVATVTPGAITIINLARNVIYIVDRKAKTYVEAALPLDFASLMPPELAPLLQNMKMTATVVPTGKKKTFGSRLCDEYHVTMNVSLMPLNIRVYATTDVPFDVTHYTEKIKANLLSSQMVRLDAASLKELGKIKGFWIASESTSEMMGAKIRSTTEVVEITKKPAPAGIYAVPSGYARRDKLSLQSLQR